MSDFNVTEEMKWLRKQMPISPGAGEKIAQALYAAQQRGYMLGIVRGWRDGINHAADVAAQADMTAEAHNIADRIRAIGKESPDGPR